MLTGFRMRVLICFTAVLLLISCGGPQRFIVPEPPPDDRRPTREVPERELELWGDLVGKTTTYQARRFFDLSRYFRAMAGQPKEAYNVDAFDQPFNSAWFTNRNMLEPLTPEAVRRGPDTGNAPDTSGTWTVIRAKAEGVTPGFSIEDPRGERYVIKFDPKGYSGLSTGAEVVGTKLFHAAGFNVPENYLVRFDPSRLQVKAGLTFTDDRGQDREMTEDDLAAIIARIEKQPDGRIRAVASRYLAGPPIGPFTYIGVRKDDPNDVIPHEHRRELRGLRVMAAWLNHYDTKANNSLDIYAKEGYVRHYLIDFGSTLGSQGDEPMPPEIGREAILDFGQVAKSVGTLGAHRRPWEMEPEIRYPSVGFFIHADFDPENYVYILPNPAFKNATWRDKYWGARLVMSFTDAQIRAAVAAGEYADPKAAAYLVDTLIKRRDIIGRTYFSRVAPLDRFRMTDAGRRVVFEDLGVETGLWPAEGRRYRWRLTADERMLGEAEGTDTVVALPAPPKGFGGDDQAVLEVRLRMSGNNDWSGPVRVFLIRDGDGYAILGVRRAAE